MRPLDGDEHRYDDIIEMPHHVSVKHPQMPVSARAAQFAPFAALSGHKAALDETARLTCGRVELDEYERDALDEKLRLALSLADKGPEITLTYFRPDEAKAGGAYLTLTGKLKRLDEYGRALVIEGGARIPIDDIIDIAIDPPR